MSDYDSDITHSDWCPYGNKTDEDTGSCVQCEADQAKEGAYWLAFFGGRAGVVALIAEEKFQREEFNGRTFEELSREEQHAVNRAQKGTP